MGREETSCITDNENYRVKRKKGRGGFEGLQLEARDRRLDSCINNYS